ncbi:MAG: NADH-quinone oxidoreductase subunit A [Candidatus Hydrogenedentes bacterium]|nr:NADH-quinone oxidoreductase subunit A [Candidatus Hydrogenedentota bacterium]
MDSGAPQTLYWPMGVYFAGVLAIVIGMIAGSYFLGSKNRDRRNAQPYESGIASTGSARMRLSADFYLFAMFFVIFDLESIFIYSWAIAVEDLGWLGYSQICIFVGAILAALWYLWRLGALDSKR